MAVIPRFLRGTGGANERNAHQRDRDMVYVDETHSYFLRGVRMKYSVTGWLGFFLCPFNEESVVNGMFQKDIDLCKDQKNSMHLVTITGKYSKYKGQTREDVLKWKNAAGLGTLMHARMEKFILEHEGVITCSTQTELEELVSVDGDDPLESHVFSQVIHAIRAIYSAGWRLFRTEWSIYDEELELAGQIDAVFERVNSETGKKEYAVIDWKRTPKNLYEIQRGPVNQFYPIEHIPCTKIAGYSLQVNLYAHMLKTVYGLNVTELLIVQAVPNLKKQCTIHTIPFMTKEIQDMIEVYRHTTQVLRDVFNNWDTLTGSESWEGYIPPYLNRRPLFYESEGEYARTIEVGSPPAEEEFVEDQSPRVTWSRAVF